MRDKAHTRYRQRLSKDEQNRMDAAVMLEIWGMTATEALTVFALARAGKLTLGEASHGRHGTAPVTAMPE